MDQYRPTEYLELFHLHFLEQFGLKTDKSLYALKGGCNLRFFLKSIRYSQDIDIDIKTVRKETLTNRVRNILESQATIRFLLSKGVEIRKISEPKQTETTQRWKILFSTEKTGIPLHTKIEFSRRGLKEGIEFELIDTTISSKYHLQPIFSCHYVKEAAYTQKLEALIGRSETQARDLFDLFHLINLGCKKVTIQKEKKEKIKERAFSISFEEFKSQVVAYLPVEYYQQYDDISFWEYLVIKVVEHVENGNP